MDSGDLRLKTKYSVQLKFAASFAVLIAVLLVLLNTYPVLTVRDQIFTSKEAALRGQAQVMSSSLAPLDALTPDWVRQVMDILDVMPLSRVLITDAGGRIVYDTSETVSDVGRYALFPEVRYALLGDVYWHSKLEDGAFNSRLSMPVMSRGTIIGSVYLYERDASQALILTRTQTRLWSLTLAVSAVAGMLIAVFSRALTLRITELARAFRHVRDGEYGYRVHVRGNDELSELGEEFNNLADRLQQIEEARRRFVSDASHELKTPLASIRLLSDSIVQSGDMDIMTMREFAEDIGNESERLQRMTEKLLSLTRLDSRPQDRVPEVGADEKGVDMEKVAENALHLLSPLAAKHEVRLELTTDGESVVRGSEDDIYQVVFNLVENGIKYTPPGGEVSVRITAAEGEVTLITEDTGVGIPDEDMPHIFSRFYRVDKARSREAGGSGIGLSIVRDAVTAYGGTVTVEAREPVGTRFVVSLPQSKVRAAGTDSDGGTDSCRDTDSDGDTGSDGGTGSGGAGENRKGGRP